MEWYKEEEDRCLYNPGVECRLRDPDKCLACGWNPEEAHRRHEQAAVALETGLPVKCVGCKLAKLCRDLGCAKTACDYYVDVRDPGLMPDLRLEIRW